MSDEAGEISAEGIVLNYLRLGDYFFLPKFEGGNGDLYDVLTNNGVNKEKIVEIEEEGTISQQGGVFNCISWVF